MNEKNQNETQYSITFDDERYNTSNEIVINIRDNNFREIGVIIKDEKGIPLYSVYDSIGALQCSSGDLEHAKLIARLRAKEMIETMNREQRNSRLAELRFLQIQQQKEQTNEKDLPF